MESKYRWFKFGSFTFGFVSSTIIPTGAHSKFWGVVRVEGRGGGDNSVQFINFGRVGDKSFEKWRQKIGDGRVGDNNFLTFSSYCTR